MKTSVVSFRVPSATYSVCLVLSNVQLPFVKLNGIVLKKYRVQVFPSISNELAVCPTISKHFLSSGEQILLESLAEPRF